MLRAFCIGMAKAFDICNAISIHRLKRMNSTNRVVFGLYGDKMTDTERLAQDWNTIGEDFRRSINKFGEMNGTEK